MTYELCMITESDRCGILGGLFFLDLLSLGGSSGGVPVCFAPHICGINQVEQIVCWA